MTTWWAGEREPLIGEEDGEGSTKRRWVGRPTR